MRRGSVALLFAVLLGLAWLATGSAHAQAWTKIDCASGHVLAPAGMPADCFQGPEDTGGTMGCHYFKYSVALPANAGQPRYYVQLRQSQNIKCGLTIAGAPANTMQHAAKFVEDEATNWSGVQALDADTNAMFFDAKNQKQEGKCFAFTKLGPLVGMAGHAYTMYGYFCKPPGQALDTAAAVAMIKAVQVKS